MKPHAHDDVSAPASFRSSMHTEPNFEAIFDIPAPHRLLMVRSRSRGGLVAGVYWEHEEYDQRGAFVARFQSFVESDQGGGRMSGWRKYDAAGHVVEEAEWLE
jgi:hypothetical protein